MRKLFYIMLIMCLCGIFGACKKDQVALSDELKTKIENEWASSERDYLWKWDFTAKYYGTYNGCVVFFECGGLRSDAHETKEIAGKDFFWTRDFSIWVYEDGKFSTLDQAYYENGKLTDEDMEMIYACHEAWIAEQSWKK